MRPSTWGIALTAVLVPAISAWNECQFPKVDFFAIDEGVGISYTYALAAMNGKMYSGGYTKGNFAFVGVKETGDDINPVPTATLWGTTTSNIQNLYIAGTPQPFACESTLTRSRAPSGGVQILEAR